MLNDTAREYLEKIVRYYRTLKFNPFVNKIKQISQLLIDAPCVYEIYGIGFPFYGEIDMRRRIYGELIRLKEGINSQDGFIKRILPDIDLLIVHESSEEGPWSVRESTGLFTKDNFLKDIRRYYSQWEKILKKLIAKFNLSRSLISESIEPMDEFFNGRRIHIDINPIPLHIWINLPAFIKEEDFGYFKVIRDLLFTTVFLVRKENRFLPANYPIDVPMKFRRNFILNLLEDNSIDEDNLLEKVFAIQPHSNLLKIFPQARRVVGDRFRQAMNLAIEEKLIEKKGEELILSKKGASFLRSILDYRQNLLREDY
jgi:hypothetical protein